MTAKHIDIVFDGSPGMPSPRFIEVENEKGESAKYGEWIQREDGYWVLRIPDTISIMEKAVKGERESIPDNYPRDAMIQKHNTCNRILSRVKSELGVE